MTAKLMKTTDTPRTDAALWSAPVNWAHSRDFVDADFARALERELRIIAAIVADLTPDQLAQPMEVVHAVERYAAEQLRLERECAELRKALEWQPIESAPKDRAILTSDNQGRVITGWWQADCWHTGWVSGGHRSDVEEIHPTHWRPLPPPPAAP